MPLTLADFGVVYRVLRIRGKDAIRHHLNNLGIVENEQISIKQKIAGNVIAEVKGVRIALDSSMAKRIEVGV